MSEPRPRASVAPAAVDVRASLVNYSAIRVVLLPVGPVPPAVFDRFLGLLIQNRRVRLQEVAPWAGAEHLPDPFVGRSWMRSHVLLDFVTQDDTRPHLHASRQSSAAVGLVHGTPGTDVVQAAAAFARACAAFPQAEVSRLWVVEADASNLRLGPTGSVNVDVVPSGMAAPKLRSYLQTLVNDMVAQVLFHFQRIVGSPQRIRHPDLVAEPGRGKKAEDRRKARLQKYLADHCLMAADYATALRLYQEATAMYRTLLDPVAEAACLEGESSAMYLAASAPGEAAGLRDEIATRYARALEQYRKASERAMEIEALLCLGRYWVQLSCREEGLDTFRDVWAAGTTLPPLDRVYLGREVGDLCARLGCRRKAAFYTREAALLEQKRVAGDTAARLFLQAAQYYGCPLPGPAGAAVGATNPGGSTSTEKGVRALQSCAIADLLQALARRRSPGRAPGLALWLLRYHAGLAPAQHPDPRWAATFAHTARQLDTVAEEVANGLAMRQRDKLEVVQDWGPATEEMLQAAAQHAALDAEWQNNKRQLQMEAQRQALADLAEACSEVPEGTPLVFSPTSWLETLEPLPLSPDLQPVPSRVKSDIDGIFIHNPFVKEPEGSRMVQWVSGARAAVRCVVRNPLMVDVPLRALEVVLAGGPVQTFPLSCTLKAEAAQAFTLECRPLGPGFCRLVGVRVTLEAAPTAQPMLWTVTDVPVACNPEAPQTVVKVLPSLPQLEVDVPPSVKLLPGEECTVEVQVHNASADQDISALELSLRPAEPSSSRVAVTLPATAAAVPLCPKGAARFPIRLRATGFVPLAEGPEVPAPWVERLELLLRYAADSPEYSVLDGPAWRREAGGDPGATAKANGDTPNGARASSSLADSNGGWDAEALRKADADFPSMTSTRLCLRRIAVTVRPALVALEVALSPAGTDCLLVLQNALPEDVVVGLRWAPDGSLDPTAIAAGTQRTLAVPLAPFGAAFHAAGSLRDFLRRLVEALAVHVEAKGGVRCTLPLRLPPSFLPSPPPPAAPGPPPPPLPPGAVTLALAPVEGGATCSTPAPLTCLTGRDYALRIAPSPGATHLAVTVSLQCADGSRTTRLDQHLCLSGRTHTALPPAGEHHLELRVWVPSLYRVEVQVQDAEYGPRAAEFSLLAMAEAQ